MGAALSCECFKGLSPKKSQFMPDMPDDRLANTKVVTLEQAMKLSRPREGAFHPTPRTPCRQTTLDGVDWATPVPYSPHPNVRSRVGSEVSEFDLDIDEVAPTKPHLQIDLDGPNRRSSAIVGKNRERSKFETEQLISSPGSLPPPMTQEQREAAIRSLLPTATYQMLAKIPQELLTKATAEVQSLRRRLARGSTVVFITAGLPGKRFIFERAAELGIKSVIIDHHDSWSKCLVDEGVVAKFLPVDMTASSGDVFNKCLELIRGLSKSGDSKIGAVDAVTTFIELSVPLVSRLCEALGLPGFRPEAVDAARDKHRTRACLKEAGLPTPRNGLIRSTAEVVDVGTSVGFPAVLKPISGAASLGVKRVNSMEELKTSYKEITDELGSLVVSSGALIKGTAGGAGVDASNIIDMTLLLEQYLDGCETDIDVVLWNGQWQYAAVADNGPTLEPYFNETWAASPSLLPKDQQQALKDLAVKSVEALGFTSGVFHVECKYTSTGPQLIEVNARMGGGQVRECNLRTWGVDLVEETIFIALGIPVRPFVAKLPLECCAYSYLNAKKSGVIADVSVVETIATKTNVVWAKPLCRSGDSAVGPADGLPTWICDLFTVGRTSKAALEYLQTLESEIDSKVTMS